MFFFFSLCRLGYVRERSGALGYPVLPYRIPINTQTYFVGNTTDLLENIIDLRGPRYRIPVQKFWA